MKRFITFLLPSVAAIISLAGCYTILQHPAVEENYSAHDYQQDCVRCHTDYHQYPYGYFYGSYPGYWWDNPRWGHYYAYPWWWDNYWYSNDYDDGGNNNNDSDAPRTGESQKAIRRDALRPPYVNGSSSTPYFHRQEIPASTGTVDGKAKPTDNSTDSDKKDADKKKESKKEEKKAERRGGKERR